MRKMKIKKDGRHGKRCGWFESYQEYIAGFIMGIMFTSIIILTVMNLQNYCNL